MRTWKEDNLLGRIRESERVVARDKDHLKKLIEERITEFGLNCDLNDIDVSHVSDMSYLFEESNFNGDISQWDVSNVENMSWMFFGSKFNGDISDWNVSDLTSMDGMFKDSPLEGNEPDWYYEY